MTDANTGEDRLAAVAAMHDRGEAISDAAVEKAAGKLSDDGNLDPETRDAIESLADRLVEGVLGPPTASLATADDERVETALELFGVDGEQADGGKTDPGTADPETDRAAARAGD